MSQTVLGNDYLLPLSDVMERAAISHSELYREFDRGKLSKIKRGRRSYVLVSDLAKYLERLKGSL